MQKMKPWTNKETEQAHAMLMTGLSYAQVAEKIGRSKGSVIGRISRSQKAPIVSEKRDRRVMALWVAGKSVAQISKITGIAKQAVSLCLPQNNNLPFPGLPGRCQFPLWGSERSTGRVCGNPVVIGKSYCADCCAKAYRSK
jgi:hypothetical protein